MPDFADEGARLEQLAREQALAAALTTRPAPEGPVPATLDCIECGESIPSGRLALFPRTRRCTRCASEIETKGGV